MKSQVERLLFLSLFAGILLVASAPGCSPTEGAPDDDWDGDGYPAPLDCQDTDPTIHPGAAESCDDIDSDCDGSLADDFDDFDGDGQPDCTDLDDDNDGDPDTSDCDDLDPTIYTGATETCRDEVDRNCDGEVDYIPWPVTCEVHLVEQNEFSSYDLEGTGLVVGSVSVNGSALKAAKGHSLEQFLNFNAEQIRNTFSNYLSNLAPYSEDTIFILDIEHPVHPRKFWTYLDQPKLLEAIVEGFKLRISIARELLPGHPIALYGTVVPQARGNDAVFDDWMDGYFAAGELGLYDDLDYVVPILYHRLQLDDPNLEVDRDAMAHQALSGASALRRTDGTALELFPLLGLKMAGNTDDPDDPDDDNLPPRPEDVDALVERVLMYDQVALFGFWTGSDAACPVQPDIPTWFESVTLVPVPDCSCPE